jgi:hypothetical protein
LILLISEKIIRAHPALYRVTLTFEHPLASLKKYVERQLDQPLRLPSFSATGLPPVSAPGFDHEGSPV